MAMTRSAQTTTIVRRLRQWVDVGAAGGPGMGPPALVADAAAEIERLQRIETAARNVAETLNGGFLVCSRCGDQESTTRLDYARELYAALGMEESKR